MPKKSANRQIYSVIEALAQAAKTGKNIPETIQRAKQTDNAHRTSFIADIASALGTSCREVKGLSRQSPRNGRKAQVRAAFGFVAKQMGQKYTHHTRAADKSGLPKKRRHTNGMQRHVS